MIREVLELQAPLVLRATMELRERLVPLDHKVIKVHLELQAPRVPKGQPVPRDLREIRALLVQPELRVLKEMTG